ncbi:hypothetical protein RMATCC62417_14722 [Rhizopus microsporus]|nr:hypothetical protein RMATCC62417_14722 [Rhizopus microsporus]
MKPLIKLQGLQSSAVDRLSPKTMMLEIMPQMPLDHQPVYNTRESPLKRIEQTALLTKNLWQTSNNVCSTKSPTTISSMGILMEEEDSEDQTGVIPDSTQDFSVGVFTREGTAVGTVSPLQPAAQTLPPTTINSSNSSVTTTNTTTDIATTTAATATTTTCSTEIHNSSRRHPSGGRLTRFCNN